MLIHIDKVVCGVGRTGKWFGYQHFDVEPDLVTMPKGVASGYDAISCTVTSAALFDEFKAQPADRPAYFRDVSTFGGCTAGPVAGLETIRIIEQEQLLDNVTAMGSYLMDGLQALKEKHQVVGDVRGKGLFAGVELVIDRVSKEPVPESYAMAVAAQCMAQGVIIGRTNRSFEKFNNTLCFSPALIAGRSEIDEIISAVDVALERIPAP